MTATKPLTGIYQWLSKPISAAPLSVFRIAFGVMMLAALIRFAANGWIDSLYLKPSYFFTYYGFEWVKPLSATGIYTVFAVLMLCAVGIALGLFYRISALVFFLLFTYVELIDKTNYLNHYYFISIMALLLALLPANGFMALDVKLKLSKAANAVPRWALLTLQLQMAIVYFFAGIAKINADWLLHAQPLKIWLANARFDYGIVGHWLAQEWVAYVFCWCGMLFDVCIPFLLLNRRTVWYAYVLVVVFHVLTAVLFPMIGMFPFIMIVCATVFLPTAFHEKLLSAFNTKSATTVEVAKPFAAKWMVGILALHFFVQVLLPFRYLLYPGELFYTEEGFRFSWRVMLMEKAGCVFFYVRDKETGNRIEVNNRDYLTMQQEKQMSTQPDMILQFARHLKTVYHTKFADPEVYAEAHVSLNGRSTRLLLNPNIDLAAQEDNLKHKTWIIAGMGD